MPSKRNRNANKNRNNTKKKKININYNSLKYKDIDFLFIKSLEFVPPIGPLRAVILDNDETTGSFLALKKLVETSKHDNYSEFIKEATNVLLNPKKGKSAFRQGIESFLDSLYTLKTEKRIDAVIMYTNMSVSPLLVIDNKYYTRPEILSDIFNEILKNNYKHIDKPLCDLIIFRQSPFPPQKFIKVIEDIYDIHDEKNKFVFFDDKPDNIFNTNNSEKPSNSAYGITEYRGKNTNKSFYNSYNSKGVKNKSVFDILNEVFP